VYALLAHSPPWHTRGTDLCAPLVPALRGDRLRAHAGRVERAAREVGRWRRRIAADPELERFRFLVDRVACEIEGALLDLTPSAGELVAWTYPGDDQAVAAALDVVDKRAAQVRHLLGGGQR
jgi:hypothetical protein